MKSALGVVALVVGCASSTPESDIPADAVPICTSVYDPLRDVSLTKPFSYVAMRGRPPGPGPDSMIFEHGTPCNEASDRTACLDRLEHLHVDGALVFHGQIVYFVAMTKDDVIVYDSFAELSKLFGEVDTAGEAALFGGFQSVIVECNLTKVWKSEHGWSLAARWDTCRDEYGIWEVWPDGRTVLVRNTQLPSPHC